MRVPFFDPGPQHAPLALELQHAFNSFLDTPRFILGEQVERFEQEVSEQLNVAHAIGVSSGTDALLCSLLALGIGAGDEVITTPFTFAATAEAIVRVGANPKFVDIDPITFNIDVALVESAITPRTKAILPVHLFGCPAEMGSLLSLAAKHGVAIVEDAAQAFGARYRDTEVGGLGTLGVFSFFPSKPLGGWGDGGMIVTQDAQLASRCRQLRSHGKNARGEHVLLGGNFRLDALQAALLRVKLPSSAEWREQRARLAAGYSQALAGVPGLVLPRHDADVASAFSAYTLRVVQKHETGSSRDLLRAMLLQSGIETAVYYPRPLHQEQMLQVGAGGVSQPLPIAEQAATEVLSLPIFPGLKAEQQGAVIARLRELCVA